MSFPDAFPFHLLEEITNNFAEDRVIGQGGYGRVYKGVLSDGKAIAVRAMDSLKGIDDKQIETEFANLMEFQHKNIVQLIGYRYEIQRQYVRHNEEIIFCVKTRRAMCSEYMQNGSLDQYISDIRSGLDWHERYRIIKGVSEGLGYLHEGSNSPVIHLNLKPSNILLDQNMSPKISDFGLSRLFGEGNVKRMGTISYMPPEFVDRQMISHKFDIYSLGVVILELMTGSRPGSNDVYSKKFVELVRRRWMERIQKTVEGTSLERYCQQVTECLEIALQCVKYDRHERPSIGDIVHRLNETETWLDVQPPELCFPFMLKGRNKDMISSRSLIKNMGDSTIRSKGSLTSRPSSGFGTLSWKKLGDFELI